MSDTPATGETPKHKKPINDTNLKIGILAGAGVIALVSSEPGNPSKTWNFPKGKHTVIPLNEGDPLYVWSKEDVGESASFFYEPKNN